MNKCSKQKWTSISVTRRIPLPVTTPETVANRTFAQLPQKCGMDAAQHRAAGGIGYGKKTIISDYGECEIAVPRDRNGEFEPKVIEKRQTRTDEIEKNHADVCERYVPA